jgi:uncharacterized membrane protein
MTELVVIGFDHKYKADETLLNFLKLEQEHLADLEDAAVVVKDAQGKIKVKPYHDLVKPGDLSNELWGGILSSIVFHRSLNLIDDPSAPVIDVSFLKETIELLKPNSSALFVLIRQADPAKVVATLQQAEGKLLRTTLTSEQIEKAKAVVEQ